VFYGVGANVRTPRKELSGRVITFVSEATVLMNCGHADGVMACVDWSGNCCIMTKTPSSLFTVVVVVVLSPLCASCTGFIGSMANLGFLDGVTLGTRRKLKGSGLTGEFYACVN